VFTVRAMAVSLVVCAAVTVLAAVLFDLSWQRAILLAPAIVIAFGAIAGLIVLWTRVALQDIRGRRQTPE
jgi:hypothetical protein